MNNKRIAQELVTIAKSLTAMRKFTVRVGGRPMSGTHWITMYSPAGYNTIDAQEFKIVTSGAERILKAVTQELALDKWERLRTVFNVETGEFEVDAKLVDRGELATPDNVVFAFEKDAGVRKTWVD